MIDIHAKDDKETGIHVEIKVEAGSVSDLAYLYCCITERIAQTMMEQCIPDAEAYMLLSSCVIDTYKQYIEDREEGEE